MFSSDFEEKLYRERLEKLEKIADLGEAAGLSRLAATYPNRFPAQGGIEPNGGIPAIRAQFDDVSAEALEADRVNVSLAGRIMAIRAQGKAGFAQLQNNGRRLQIYVRLDAVGEPAFALYKLLDLGDHIGVTGYLFRTRTGELTIHVTTLTFLSKAMLALPDKFHGLQDIELRYRQRYLDLFTDEGEPAAALPISEITTELSFRPESAQLHRADGAEKPAVLSPAEIAPDTASDAVLATATNPEAIAVATPGMARLPAREVFVKRAQTLKALRKFFDERGYLEVETPMMQPVAGGAAARPFVTHHNTMDMDLYLRIAPELYLKRLVVGGLDRVYEINRNFRNEGISTQHNPEFTMLEFYQAYSNYHDLMDLTEDLIPYLANQVNGTTLIHFPIPKGPRAGEMVEIDLCKWQRLSMREAIVKFWPQELTNVMLNVDISTPKQFEAVLFTAKDFFRAEFEKIKADEESVLNELKVRHDLTDLSDYTMHQVPESDPDKSRWRELDKQARLYWRSVEGFEKVLTSHGGRLYSDAFEFLSEFPLITRQLFNSTVRDHLIQPTIIYDFPLAVSPLSKVKPDEPDWVERFEFYIGGFEIGNAFSELNDPEDQRRRFQAQVDQKNKGDEEASDMDEDYVRALQYGLPPTAGEGIGVDRLTMLLTGSRSIRDVILFPLLRPVKQAPADTIENPPE